MTTIYKRVAGIFLALSLTVSSCDDFLDVNDNPNALAEVPAATLLPTMITQLGFYSFGNFSLYTGSVMQYYAGHRGQPLQYAQITFRPSDTDNSWSAMYAGVLQDATQLEQQALEGERLAYAGMAQIIKANTFMLLTDIYGDIPFTEVNNIGEFITTQYDSQEQVYDGILALLDDGIQNLESETENYVGNEDLLYQGDLDGWIRYANTLKLRALNHLSLRRPEAALNFLNTNPDLIASNGDNALVTFYNAPQQYNPRFNFDNISGRQDAAVSSTFVNLLDGLNDPRFLHYFEPITNGPNAGTVAGNAPGNDQDDSGRTLFSRVGWSVAAPDAPVVLASYAETQFMIAEIRFRAGEAALAQEAYENAVEASINYHSSVAGGLTYTNSGVTIPVVSEAEINAYLAQSAVAYNNTLQRIMQQKYIAMYTMPYEAWVDWRRTGVPNLSPPVINPTQNRIPLRLPYPQVEIDLNGVNLAAGPGIPVPNQTLVTEPVWWDAN